MATRARGMLKSVHSPEQLAFRRLLVEARKRAGLTQEELAKRLKKPQSFVAKYVYVRDDSDDYVSFYVQVSKDSVSAIGSRVDEDVDHFRCEHQYVEDQPEWLDEHPVLRFLNLTVDAEMAMAFALAPRRFCGTNWHRGDKTAFRPAFADPIAHRVPGLSQDTIAAYLLRNFVSAGPEIFEVLKADALAKQAAARAVIEQETSQYRRAFEERYED